jgi:small GTP-binding protein
MGSGGSTESTDKLRAEYAEKMMQQQARTHEKMTDVAAQHAKEMRMQDQKHTALLLDQLNKNNSYQAEQDAKFEKFKAENAKLVQDFDDMQEAHKQELLKAKENFMKGAVDPDKYQKFQDDTFQKFCVEVESVKGGPKTLKPSVAVLGDNGVGKSSLINALAEELVTPVGDTDTTKVVSKVYESSTTEYWDVPGCSQEHSYFNLQQIMAVKEMHLIIIVYVDRVEHIVKLEQFIRACQVPYLCVRNKVDQIEDQNGKSAGDRKTEAADEEARKLQCPLIFVSSKTKEGIDNLKAWAKRLGVSLDSSDCPPPKRQRM